jgi:hypothetical protein
MTRALRWTIVLVGLLTGFATNVSAGDLSAKQLEKGRLAELKKTAEQIREIILRKDVSGLLECVRPDQDDFTKDTLSRDLHDPNSWLYGNLFDSEVLQRHASSPRDLVSVRDYLMRAENLKIVVGFYEDAGRKKVDWAWLMFRSSNFPKTQWPLATFFYIRGRWWITDLFEHQP